MTNAIRPVSATFVVAGQIAIGMVLAMCLALGWFVLIVFGAPMMLWRHTPGPGMFNMTRLTRSIRSLAHALRTAAGRR